MKLRKRNHQSDGLNTSRFAPYLCLEIAVCVIFTPPGVDQIFTGTMLDGTYLYTLSDVFLLIMLMRFYLFVRLYEHYSK